MKRILAACIEQTIHFQLKDECEPALAREEVKGELERYKLGLDRCHTRYKVLEQTSQPDGSIIVKLRKQYNYHDCGSYLD